MTVKSNISYTKVAYFGHPGSFSSKAARKFLKSKNIKDYYLFPCQTFEEVMDYVLVGGCYGVLPYYNNTAGQVKRSERLLSKYNELVIDDIEIPVHHYLAGLSTVNKIKKIASHPQALSQCKEYLAKNFPKAELVPYSTTSTAAYDLSNGLLPKDYAVIASKEAVEKYRLRIVDSRIEDSPTNSTRFKVLFKP